VLFNPWIRDQDQDPGTRRRKIQIQNPGSGMKIPDLIFEN
jgi:hypothetical protein